MSIYVPGDPEYLGYIDNNGDGISDIGGVYSPIENKSFALLRTNPKLTTNIKLIVDSNDSMYFSAFKANKELSKVEFQKYALKSSGNYSNDIVDFYKGLPNSIKYQTLRNNSDLTIYSEYSNQYETQYQYGVTHNTTKLYDEQYRVFAPIWLEKTTPKKFVIYRIEDVDYREDYEENVSGQNGRILELLNEATIIKTFDLSRSSEIGKYIYKHVNAKNFPNSMITFNFGEGETSSFNGIDITKGGFAKKSENLDESYTTVDFPEIYSNEVITRGFSRNGIVSANIMNLEFLFDDNTAEDYKIYRYFGLYVDDTVEGEFDIDGIDSRGVISLNESTYATKYNIENTSLNPIDMIVNQDDLKLPTLNYVKDKNSNFYHIRNSFSALSDYKIPISTNGSTVEDFRGFSKAGSRLTAISKDAKTKGFIKLTIEDNPTNNDRVFIGDKSEIEILGNDLTTFIFIADSSLDEGTFNGNRFSSKGDIKQVVLALSQSIYQTSLVDYKVHTDGDSIIIEDFLDGNRRRQTAFGIYKANSSNFIKIDDAEFNDKILDPSINADWDIWTPISGSSKNQLIYVSESEIGGLKVGQFLKTKNLETFSQIIEISQDPFDTSVWRVILDKPTILSDDNVFDVYEIYRVKHGKFSVYNFKDFDFDFYSTRNTNVGDLKKNGEAENPLEYFSWMTPILETDEINQIQNLDILSEYDRLDENILKETSIKSRIAPTICKFHLKDSSNAKNMEYILNANEAFGSDNMSPNIEIASTRNVEYLNMEHFHFNTIPDYLHNYPEQDLNNYIDYGVDGGLTIDKLTSTYFNFFNHGLIWDGWNTDSGWVDNKLKVNYSKFIGGNTQNESSAVFRGLRYLYKKRKENQLEEPTDFINTFEVNGYKFGTIVNYNRNTGTNDVTYKVVKNDIFKFICVYIEISTVTNDVEYLDPYNVYSLDDITDAGVIIDVNIPFQIDIAASQWGAPSEEATLTASSFSILDGTADFEKYVTKNNEGEYSWIIFEALGDWYGLKVVDIIDKTRIIVSGHPYQWNIVDGEPFANQMPQSQFSFVGVSTQFIYFEAGKNQFANLLEQVNAHNFAERFNKFGEIEYINVDLDGNITYNDYVLSVESGSQFIKPSLITTSIDPDKPKAYQLTSGSVGSIIVDRKDGGYITVLRRMNGDYNPLFNNSVNFTDIYNYNKIPDITTNERERLIYNKFNNNGIAFGSFKERELGFGYINNYFYHKVNDENSKNILKLSQTTDKLPLYPKIGEIAIDRKNINLFKSKYSSDFFSRAIAAGGSELVHGTLSPIEKENFFASTVMKVKDVYDITKYTQTVEDSIERLDEVRINQLNKTSIHWTEDRDSIDADFYLPKAISNELKEDAIEKQFARYVNAKNSFGDKSTILDDLDVYIDNNITSRFIIDSIKVYGIEKKEIETEFTSVTETSELTNDGYKELTNYTVQSYQSDALSFRLIYNKRPGYSYKLRVHIKIQA